MVGRSEAILEAVLRLIYASLVWVIIWNVEAREAGRAFGSSLCGASTLPLIGGALLRPTTSTSFLLCDTNCFLCLCLSHPLTHQSRCHPQSTSSLLSSSEACYRAPRSLLQTVSFPHESRCAFSWSRLTHVPAAAPFGKSRARQLLKEPSSCILVLTCRE